MSGLYSLILDQLSQEPLSGAVFVFSNRRRDTVKLFCYDAGVLEQQLARTGVSLARSTQVSLMAQLDQLVQPLVDHLRAAVLGSGYVHLDATPIGVLDPERPGGSAVRSSVGLPGSEPGPGDRGAGVVRLPGDEVAGASRRGAQGVSGVIQTDGASGLNALGPPTRITHLGCWAHARRYVVEAVRLGEPRAAGYLARIDRLFRWDARARHIAMTKLASAARVAMWRARFSAPVMQTLFAQAITDGLVLPPKSALGVAVGYLLGQRASRSAA